MMSTNLGQLGFQNHLASGGGAPAPGWTDERRAQAVEGKGECLIIPAQRADQAGTQMQDGTAAPDPATYGLSIASAAAITIGLATSARSYKLIANPLCLSGYEP